MESDRRARRPALAWAWLAVAGATLVSVGARPARADEPWPPTTPPRVDLPPDAPAHAAPAPPPPVVGPLAAPTPPPVGPAPQPVTEPLPTVETSTADETLVRAAAPVPSGGGVSYGSEDGQLFLRTSRDELVLLPSLRLDTDAFVSSNFYASTSDNQIVLSRARVDVAGWASSKVFFDLSADFANGPSLRYVDNYVAVAPWGDRVIFQLGQFDAPFTLENRTSDRYLDFIHRGAAVRAFAIPENKDQGAMVHGTNPARNFYYSAAVLNGAGPTVSTVDSRLDVMARAWIAPFSFSGRTAAFREVTVGGSAWTGDRSQGPVFGGQATEAGHVALDPNVYWTTPPSSRLLLREQGRFRAFAVELNAPVGRRFGARFEWITKNQPLSAFDVTNPNREVLVAGLTLSGWATYGEAWAWVLGDNRMLGVPAQPGLELPLRLRDLETSTRQHGVMLAVRVDHIDERMALGPSAMSNGLGASAEGTNKLTTLTLGATYWFTRRARVNMNYVFNFLGGGAPYVSGIQNQSDYEILVRTSLAL